jgi:hypothetical protein
MASSTSGESSRCHPRLEIFIAAQKRPLDRGVIDIQYASGGPDSEFEIELD